jgi:hypothetical protein
MEIRNLVLKSDRVIRLTKPNRTRMGIVLNMGDNPRDIKTGRLACSFSRTVPGEMADRVGELIFNVL